MTFKRGDRVFVEAEFLRDTNFERNGVMLEVNNNGNHFFLHCASAIVHASLPEKPDSSPVDSALFAWRAWLVEAAALVETPVDCLDMAREIREGAAHGLTLGEGDSHLPRPRPTRKGVGRFLHTVELESLRARNERLREKAGALLHALSVGVPRESAIALREELDRYDDETETNSEVEI